MLVVLVPKPPIPPNPPKEEAVDVVAGAPKLRGALLLTLKADGAALTCCCCCPKPLNEVAGAAEVPNCWKPVEAGVAAPKEKEGAGAAAG